MTSQCSNVRLEEALAGSLPADDEETLCRHLEECEECSAAMERLAGGTSWSQEAAAMLAEDELDRALPVREAWSEIEFTIDYLDPADEPNVLGRIGGYDVLEILGRGGMGVVLKGYDRELKRCVAIKVLAPHLAHSSLARKRFAREAQAAAAIVHANVLAIHQVQPSGRLPFLVMPLVAGESVAERLVAKGTLELKEILRIAMQAAAGLAAAHEQGLVHRDVKPANILLEKGVERAVLTDFGLACAADDVALTQWGIIAGTPQYMSPEQARAQPLDGRSDLFSLGCVLYEMATGVSPFKADSTMATMRRLVDDAPQALASLNPELPPWFIAIVGRLLEKDPSQRFGSAKEVSELLEGCLAHVQQPASVPLPAALPKPSARPESGRRKSRVKGVMAMFAITGAVLLGALGWMQTEPPDIAGQWKGEEWGTVVLKKTHAGEYTGTYTDTFGKKPGEILLKWSRIEGRFNGAWREGEDRFGELSVRVVNNEIRGALTTDAKSKINPATPRLADLTWARYEAKKYMEPKDASADVGSPMNGMIVKGSKSNEAKTVWDILGLKLQPVKAAEVPGVEKLVKNFKGGLRVLELRPDSPAFAAKLRQGDVLIGAHQGNVHIGLAQYDTVDHKQVAYVATRLKMQPDLPFNMLVIRGDELKTLPCRLEGAVAVEPVAMEQFTGRIVDRQEDSAKFPATFTFAVDERSYLRYQRLLSKGFVGGVGSPLHIGLRDEDGFPHQGSLNGFNNEVDPKTGTVQARGSLPDPRRLLLPGMFVRVRMPFGIIEKKAAGAVKNKEPRLDPGSRAILIEVYDPGAAPKVGEYVDVIAGHPKRSKTVVTGAKLLIVYVERSKNVVGLTIQVSPAEAEALVAAQAEARLFIARHRFAALPKNYRALAVRALLSAVNLGTMVDVLSVVRQEDGSTKTRKIAEKVGVLAVDAPRDPKRGGHIVTLAVTAAQAEESVLAQERGTIRLVVLLNEDVLPPYRRDQSKIGKEQAQPVVVNSRTFKVPVHIDPRQREQIKRVTLLCSTDQGKSWLVEHVRSPEAVQDGFRIGVEKDGEYWFAIAIEYKDGRVVPERGTGYSAALKIRVDTSKGKSAK